MWLNANELRFGRGFSEFIGISGPTVGCRGGLTAIFHVTVKVCDSSSLNSGRKSCAWRRRTLSRRWTGIRVGSRQDRGTVGWIGGLLVEFVARVISGVISGIISGLDSPRIFSRAHPRTWSEVHSWISSGIYCSRICARHCSWIFARAHSRTWSDIHS